MDALVTVVYVVVSLAVLYGAAGLAVKAVVG
jgi:hypothetical protein